ncbi:MAG: 7TM domain-containing protein [Candidatus Dojkabacteria bacterium]
MLEILTESLQIEPGVVVLLFMLPIVVTLIAIARHIFGLRALSVFIAIILVFTFYQFGLEPEGFRSDPVNGLKFGITFLLLVFVTTTVTYGLIKNWALHYYPKLAIVMTSVATVIVLVLLIAARFDVTGIVNLNLFSILLLAAMAEKLMSLLARKNFQATLGITIESFLLAGMIYLLISWHQFQNFTLASPYLIILLIPINYIIGRFSGLRFKELYRFRDILDRDE